ncbi:imidazole glycerol phosphate synthase subunit HisH [Lysobacter sp. A3-1-A15]|uniref:imidazole glycerol phosphate synthase subunit HisH n=1 Tax=Novilysobacter viscosus TaxID=3098602 RepID=UPI002ED92563
MKVVLVDSGGANIGSVRYALERFGVDAPLTADVEAIRSADRVILPGVGAAAAAMARLEELGLVELLRTLPQPLLGICLGMQLLFESSAEGNVACLARIPARVAPMAPAPGIRVPHMGWNRLRHAGGDPILSGIADGAQAYFVHGYAAPVGEWTVAASTHGAPFSAVVRSGRCWGAQFHPERSGDIGAKLLRNFLEVPA